MQITEMMAVAFALLYVVLAASNSKWCWPSSVISVVLYTKICYESGLLLETLLQVFYLVMAFAGWYSWNNRGKKEQLQVSKMSPGQQNLFIGTAILLSLITGYLFDRFTGAALPWLDAPVTVFSLFATWMVTRKYLENWIWWIFIDAAAAVLYGLRGLSMSAGLYVLYALLSIAGYSAWKRELKTS